MSTERRALTLRLEDRVHAVLAEVEVPLGCSSVVCLSWDFALVDLKDLVLVELVVLPVLGELALVLAPPVPVRRRRSRVDLPRLISITRYSLREVGCRRLEGGDVGVLEEEGGTRRVSSSSSRRQLGRRGSLTCWVSGVNPAKVAS